MFIQKLDSLYNEENLYVSQEIIYDGFLNQNLYFKLSLDISQVFRYYPILTKNLDYSVNMERTNIINISFDFLKNKNSLINDILIKTQRTNRISQFRFY